MFDDDLDAPFGGRKESGIRGEDVLKEGEEALGSIHVLAADTYRLAQKLVPDYGLSGQTRALNSDLQKVFAYMEKNKGNLNTHVLNSVINDLARSYIDSITEMAGRGEYFLGRNPPACSGIGRQRRGKDRQHCRYQYRQWRALGQREAR